LVIYNTLSRRKELFKSGTNNVVKIYECGPTVYNFIHIGNARPLCVFDSLRRYLVYLGYDVIFVKNFTDIDDKIINRASDDGVSWDEVAERFVKEYYVDAQGLGELRPTYEPKATENLSAMQKIIKKLFENGFAYKQGDGTVYFRARKFEKYGQLSGMVLEDLQAGVRVPTSEQKEDPLDFALWKAAKQDEPCWESPWGNGRPGWHIECSAMIDSIFENTIDIHCGGRDLIFPHHENELAQYTAYCGKPLANYWMHNGFVTVDNEKMAKSVGNFFTVREVANVFGYMPIRLLMLQAHYRTPINYSVDAMKQSLSSLQRIRNCLELLGEKKGQAAETKSELSAKRVEALETLKSRFFCALDDDFNTGGAIGVLFDFVREVNSRLAESGSFGQSYIEAATKILGDFLGILGLDLNRPETFEDEQVKLLVDQREISRANKDFKRADELRRELKKMGISVEDTPSGVKVRKDVGGLEFE
jgi:cysteinyl-tRNA synthetase